MMTFYLIQFIKYLNFIDRRRNANVEFEKCNPLFFLRIYGIICLIIYLVVFLSPLAENINSEFNNYSYWDHFYFIIPTIIALLISFVPSKAVIPFRIVDNGLSELSEFKQNLESISIKLRTADESRVDQLELDARKIIKDSDHTEYMVVSNLLSIIIHEQPVISERLCHVFCETIKKNTNNNTPEDYCNLLYSIVHYNLPIENLYSFLRTVRDEIIINDHKFSSESIKKMLTAYFSTINQFLANPYPTAKIKVKERLVSSILYMFASFNELETPKDFEINFAFCEHFLKFFEEGKKYLPNEKSSKESLASDISSYEWKFIHPDSKLSGPFSKELEDVSFFIKNS